VQSSLTVSSVRGERHAKLTHARRDMRYVTLVCAKSHLFRIYEVIKDQKLRIRDTHTYTPFDHYYKKKLLFFIE